MEAYRQGIFDNSLLASLSFALIRAPHASFAILIRRLVDPDSKREFAHQTVPRENRQAAVSDRIVGADCISKPINARYILSTHPQIAAYEVQTLVDQYLTSTTQSNFVTCAIWTRSPVPSMRCSGPSRICVAIWLAARQFARLIGACTLQSV